jgi:acetyl esterase
MSQVDPQAAALLAQFKAYAAQQPTPTRAPTADEKIVATRLMMKSFGPLGISSEPVLRVKDFELSGPAGKVPVRLYVPKTDTPLPKSSPAFIYYHGGGFVAGDLDSYDTLLCAIANRAGCLVLSVAYRLAPENPYPAANNDALAALNWVVDHASEIGADPERLAVGGDSAGGLLAAWVAQRAIESEVDLRLQLLFYPSLDATTSSESWKKLGTGEYILSHTQTLEWYDAYLPDGINRADPKVSPLFATDLAGIAPALIITADHDPLHDEGDEYANKLKAAGVMVDHTCWPGMIHGVVSMAGVIDAGKAIIDRAAAALGKAFATPR